MSISIEKQFKVHAPPERVWSFLIDLHQVAACLPGSKISGQDETGTYTGTIRVKLGPVSSTYRGIAHFERLDDESWVAELTAEGKDTRGKGGAGMTMRSTLAESGDGTDVSVVSTVRVTGVLARLGRGMIDDVSDELFEQFTSCMKSRLEVEELGEEGSAGTLGESAEAEVDAPNPAPPAAPVLPDRSSPPAVGDDEEALDLTAVGASAARKAIARPGFWLFVLVVALVLWVVLG